MFYIGLQNVNYTYYDFLNKISIALIVMKTIAKVVLILEKKEKKKDHMSYSL